MAAATRDATPAMRWVGADPPDSCRVAGRRKPIVHSAMPSHCQCNVALQIWTISPFRNVNEPQAAADAPKEVVYLILGSLQFSEAALRVYGHPRLLAVAAAINGPDFT